MKFGSGDSPWHSKWGATSKLRLARAIAMPTTPDSLTSSASFTWSASNSKLNAGLAPSLSTSRSHSISRDPTYESRALVEIPSSASARFKTSTASAPLYLQQSVQASSTSHTSSSPVLIDPPSSSGDQTPTTGTDICLSWKHSKMASMRGNWCKIQRLSNQKPSPSGL
jgi:hypothetical protein